MRSDGYQRRVWLQPKAVAGHRFFYKALFYIALQHFCAVCCYLLEAVQTFHATFEICTPKVMLPARMSFRSALFIGWNRRCGLRNFRFSCAFKPRRVPQIQQHLRSRRQSVGGEVEGFWRTFAVKSTGFVEGIDLFNMPVRLSEVSHVIRKGVG